MYKMLVVDDEIEIRKGLNAINWTTYGIELCGSCTNGLEAYHWIQNNEVDLILCDLNMPIMGGLELAGLVQKHYPYIFVIILTGYDDFEFIRESLRCGVLDYLIKPLDIEELQKTISKVVSEFEKRHQDKLRFEIIERRNHLYSKLFRKNFMKELFSRSMELEEIEDGCIFSEMTLNSSSYTVCVFIIDALSEKRESYNNENWKLIIFALDNILSEYCETNEIGYSYIEPQNGDSFIIFTSNASQKEPENIKTHIENIKNNLYCMGGLFKTTFSCGIGSTVHKAADIFISGIHAKTAETHKRNDDDIIVYSSGMMGITEYSCGNSDKSDMEIAGKEPGNGIHYSKHIIESAKKYINENFMKSISLEEVAAQVYLNPVYFSYLFKNATGQKFITYLTNCRIIKAKELLKEPAYKINEICEMVGYQDSRYFSQIFKKNTGKTPYEYRSYD